MLKNEHPKRGDLRIAHIPQVPGEPFHVYVSEVREAAELLHILAAYDAFQYEHRVKPDYFSASDLEVYDPEDGGWITWYSTDDEDLIRHMRNGDDVDTLVWAEA